MQPVPVRPTPQVLIECCLDVFRQLPLALALSGLHGQALRAGSPARELLQEAQLLLGWLGRPRIDHGACHPVLRVQGKRQRTSASRDIHYPCTALRDHVTAEHGSTCWLNVVR